MVTKNGQAQEHTTFLRYSPIAKLVRHVILVHIILGSNPSGVVWGSLAAIPQSFTAEGERYSQALSGAFVALWAARLRHAVFQLKCS